MTPCHLCVAPLSHELRKCEGFRCDFQKDPITHLMFMDNLKVSPSSTKTRYLTRIMCKHKMYEGSAAKLTRTMGKVNDVSEAIGMILGLRKCAVVHVRGGEVVRRGPLKLKPGICDPRPDLPLSWSPLAPHCQSLQDKRERSTGVQEKGTENMVSNNKNHHGEQ